MITIDVGNSSIGIGRFEAGEWVVQYVREPAAAAALVDGEAVAISVAPARLRLLQSALLDLGGSTLRELQRPPPRLTCASPALLQTAGADRLANVLAILPGPGIVVDAGTAVTIDIVDGAGVYRGGFITAGPRASSEGLAVVTAQLPRLPGTPQQIKLGESTQDALGAGLWGAAVGGVDRLVDCALQSLPPGSQASVVVTGGWGSAWATASRHAGVRVVPHLVHIGIARWAEWM